MSWTDHDHRGDYAEARHDHDGEYAEKWRRHYDDEATIGGLREDLNQAREQICELEEKLNTRVDNITQDVRALWAHISNMPGGV